MCQTLARARDDIYDERGRLLPEIVRNCCFVDDMSLRERILTRRTDLPPLFNHFLRKALVNDPKKRARATALLKHKILR